MAKSKKSEKKKAKKAAERELEKKIKKADKQNAKGKIKGSDLRKSKKAVKGIVAEVKTSDPTVIDGKAAMKAQRQADYERYAAEVEAEGSVPVNYQEWKRRPGDSGIAAKATAREAGELHRAHLSRVGELTALIADPTIGAEKRGAAEAELELLRDQTNERQAKPDDESEVDFQHRRLAEKRELEAFAAMSDTEKRDYIRAKREQRELDANAEWSKARADEGEDPADAKERERAAEKVEVAEFKAKKKGVEPGSAGPEPKAKKSKPVDTTKFESYGAPAVKGEKKSKKRRLADGEIDGVSQADVDAADAELVRAETSAPEPFADPVTGEMFDPDQNIPTNGQGRPLVWIADDNAENGGKLVPMTRVTTGIDKLEDKKLLEAWKIRSTLAGAAIADVSTDLDSPSIIERAGALAAEYELAIEKTDKLDRKGKLFAGEMGMRLEAAKKAYDRGMDGLAEEAMTIAGTHLKAEHGTHLHALTAIFDDQGPDALRATEPTPADMLDVQAYAAATKKLGLEVVEVEKRVVVPDRGETGTLDRIYYYKPEGATRRIKVVGDLKTGRIDYGAGKIAMQIGDYAQGEGYDPITHEYEKLGVSKTIGLLIHLPAGMATCTIYEVDLRKGHEGLKLASDVKVWRQTTTEAQSYRGKTPYYRELVAVDMSDAPKETKEVSE